MAPTFLALDEVLEIHNDQIARYGGAAGIRDLGRLLAFAIVFTCLHRLFVILLAFERTVLLARRHLIALLDKGVGDDHLGASEEERQEAVGFRFEGIDRTATRLPQANRQGPLQS